MDVVCEERGAKDGSRVLGLNSWVNGDSIPGYTSGGAVLFSRGEMGASSVCFQYVKLKIAVRQPSLELSTYTLPEVK